METSSQTFLIADDHPLFRSAMRQTLVAMFGNATVLEAASLDEAGEKLNQTDIDLVLLDLTMHGFNGLIYLRAQFPSIPVVIVSANEDEATINRCLEFGTLGFLPKSLSVDQIHLAMETVLTGETWVPPGTGTGEANDAIGDLITRLSSLTPQQVRVLMMLRQGLLNKQIAYELGVSEATIKAHVSAILQKLDVDSRTQAVIVASKIEAGQWQSLETK